MYFIIPHMYFRVNLQMNKPTLCCCFTWIVFLKLNFIVALLLIRKTWMIDLPIRWGMGDFKKWGDPSNEEVDTPLRTMISRKSIDAFSRV